jgi:hypothetical protein
MAPVVAEGGSSAMLANAAAKSGTANSAVSAT